MNLPSLLTILASDCLLQLHPAVNNVLLRKESLYPVTTAILFGRRWAHQKYGLIASIRFRFSSDICTFCIVFLA